MIGHAHIKRVGIALEGCAGTNRGMAEVADGVGCSWLRAWSQYINKGKTDITIYQLIDPVVGSNSDTRV